MRWVVSLATVSTLCVFSLWGNADVESRVSLLECKMKAAHDDMFYDCRGGARFASGRPFLNSNGFWAVGDVLYWTSYQGGTEIAYSTETDPGGQVPNRIRSQQFDWDVGYRLGLGWVTPHDNMELSALFTRVEPDGDFGMRVQDPNELDGIIIPGIAGFSRASADWNLKYSTLDVELSRSYFLSRYFYLRPYFGSRTAWIRQGAQLSFTAAAEETVLSHLRNDFTGSGLRVGSDSKWFFAKHWNFFMGASASALYGKYTVETGSNQVITYGADIAASVYRMAVAAQTQVGLGWETNFSCDSNQIAINVGYELNYWWRQNQQPNLESISGVDNVYGARQSKDLGFHGLTVDIQLAF